MATEVWTTGSIVHRGNRANAVPPADSRKYVFTVDDLSNLVARALHERGVLRPTDVLNCQWQIDATGKSDLYVDVYVHEPESTEPDTSTLSDS